MDRRDAIRLTAAASAAALLQDRLAADDTAYGAKKQIAMLIYPGFTALDVVGPQTVLSALHMYGYDLPKLVWKNSETVTADTGIQFRPNVTFADCAADVDIVFVPGGARGTLKVMQDKEALRFLAGRARTSSWVTSVCTGSLVLGAAGLLKGYKATSHWAARDLLTRFGAKPTASRVVFDRNRVTGAGVTAGLDFALELVKRIAGEKSAKLATLAFEYDPAPPFDCGNADDAPVDVVAPLRAMYAPFVRGVRGVKPRD